MQSARQNSRFRQRIRDIVFASIAVLIIWPLLLVLALLVLIFTGTPIIYSERRTGRYGIPFTIYKFRTMLAGAHYSNHIAPDDDPHITRLGLRLRRWRLDELPQLFNILRGDMTLVGPRPMPPEHAAAIPDRFRSRILSVRPGITGRSSLDFMAEDRCLAGMPDPQKAFLEKLLPARIEHEVRYLDDPDPYKDWQILAETLATIWSANARARSARLVGRILDSPQSE